MSTPALEHEWDLKSVDFPLTEESVVFDIGAYKGRWAREIATRYNPHLFAFEPQPWAAELCRRELESFPKAKVFEHGLGVDTGLFPMDEFGTDGCTFEVGYSTRDQIGQGRLVEILSFIKKNRVKKIDLCMMNIEGYEFRLIPYMLENGVFERIRYFMCQFHLFGDQDSARYEALRDAIYEKMDYHFDYGRVLTCWVRK